jgi:hypothetical protein
MADLRARSIVAATLLAHGSAPLQNLDKKPYGHPSMLFPTLLNQFRNERCPAGLMTGA